MIKLFRPGDRVTIYYKSNPLDYFGIVVKSYAPEYFMALVNWKCWKGEMCRSGRIYEHSNSALIKLTEQDINEFKLNKLLL